MNGQITVALGSYLFRPFTELPQLLILTLAVFKLSNQHRYPCTHQHLPHFPCFLIMVAEGYCSLSLFSGPMVIRQARWQGQCFLMFLKLQVLKGSLSPLCEQPESACAQKQVFLKTISSLVRCQPNPTVVLIPFIFLLLEQNDNCKNALLCQKKSHIYVNAYKQTPEPTSHSLQIFKPSHK